MGLFTKSTWRLVRAHVQMTAAEMESFGFETACELVDQGYASKLYYCRYLLPEIRCVEFKLLPLREDRVLREFLRGMQDVTEVTVEPWDGSGGEPYAQAFVLARLLRGKGDDHMADVTHWLFNMTGFNYAQEVGLHARAISIIAGHLTTSNTHWSTDSVNTARNHE